MDRTCRWFLLSHSDEEAHDQTADHQDRRSQHKGQQPSQQEGTYSQTACDLSQKEANILLSDPEQGHG